MGMWTLLKDSIFGVNTKMPKGALCRWCNAPIGVVSHAPIPLCEACWMGSREKGLWNKAMTDFPAESDRWARAQQCMPTSAEVAADAADALGDMSAMQREVFALIREGKSEEAGKLAEECRQRAADIRKAQHKIGEDIQKAQLEIDALIRQREGVGT